MIALFSILLVVYVLMLLWLLRGLKRLRRADAETVLPRMSVVVAARDEAAHLADCLEALHMQEYAGDWELFIIDDHSRDETLPIALAAAARHPNWHVAQNERAGFWSSRKKGALETALQLAQGDVLLFTDADCTPPPTWIRGIAVCFTPQTALCAGFSPLKAPEAALWWQHFLHIDTLATALVAAGSIGHRRGITCTGRNLACRREVLVEIGGYGALPDTLSGDDDFLLQTIVGSTARSITYAVNPQSSVPARGPSGWNAFLRQKRRHLSAGLHYERSVQTGYLLYHGANYLLWSSLLIGMLYNTALIPLLPLKLLVDSLMLFYWSRVLGQPFPITGFFTWEILFPLYHLISFPCPGKEISWKNP